MAFYDHEKPLAGGSGGASAPPGRPKVTAPGGNMGVALRSKIDPRSASAEARAQTNILTPQLTVYMSCDVMIG